jgi:spermidine synthase
VIPLVVIERVATPLGEMVLSRRANDFTIRVAGVELMSSVNHRSEDELGRITCEPLAKATAPKVLIGGLGLGFTLRAALDVLSAKANVEVCELVPEVVRWNRTLLGQLAKHPLADPRVTVIEDDVGAVIGRATGHYDAIVLDVDNGPDGVGRRNDGLYRAAGLAAARRALVDGGLLAVWSSFESQTFTRWLTGAGFAVEIEKIKAHGTTHWIWMARAAATPAKKPRR